MDLPISIFVCIQIDDNFILLIDRPVLKSVISTLKLYQAVHDTGLKCLNIGNEKCLEGKHALA